MIFDISKTKLSFDSTSLVSMLPSCSEEPRYEDNELKKYRDFSCMCCNFSHEKASGRRGDFIARW
jgi:hypothetical protein